PVKCSTQVIPTVPFFETAILGQSWEINPTLDVSTYLSGENICDVMSSGKQILYKSMRRKIVLEFFLNI
ncbi:MAG: hypothetical protein P8048_13250, partial [Calditrichia bacterium]